MHGLIATDYEAAKNLANAIASLATTAAIVGGAVWAFFRFRRTPDGRAKVSIALDGRWTLLDDRPHVLSTFQVLNDGGSTWTALAESSWIELWALTAHDDAISDGSIDWSKCETASVRRVLDEDQLLPSRDVIGSSVMFELPRDAVAAMLVLKLSIRVRRKVLNPYYWPTADTVVLPSEVETVNE